MKYTPREFQDYAVRAADHDNIGKAASNIVMVAENLADYLNWANRKYGDDARHHITVKDVELDLGNIIAQVATLGADLELNLDRIMKTWVDANYENYTI